MNIILWVGIYGFIYLCIDRIPLESETKQVLRVIAVGVYIILLAMSVYKKKRQDDYGIRRPQIGGVRGAGMLISLLLIPGLQVILAEGRYPCGMLLPILLLCFTSFLEEFFFRGVLFSVLKEQYHMNSDWSRIILTAILFGLFHMCNLLQGAELGYTILQVVFACELGICFGILVIYTGSILPGAVIHMLINGTAMGVSETGKTAFWMVLLSTGVLIYVTWNSIWKNNHEIMK